jgi:hypothetical protein
MTILCAHFIALEFPILIVLRLHCYTSKKNLNYYLRDSNHAPSKIIMRLIQYNNGNERTIKTTGPVDVISIVAYYTSICSFEKLRQINSSADAISSNHLTEQPMQRVSTRSGMYCLHHTAAQLR